MGLLQPQQIHYDHRYVYVYLSRKVIDLDQLKLLLLLIGKPAFLALL